MFSEFFDKNRRMERKARWIKTIGPKANTHRLNGFGKTLVDPNTAREISSLSGGETFCLPSNKVKPRAAEE